MFNALLEKSAKEGHPIRVGIVGSGKFGSGLVAQLTNPVVSVVSGGIGTLLVVAGWTGLFPSLRNLGSLSSLTAQPQQPAKTG